MNSNIFIGENGEGLACPSNKTTRIKTHVTIDHRERSSRVPDALASMEGVTINYAQLPRGDYLVNEKTLFERKTFLDFSCSLIDGRLFRQARQLVENSDRGVFILEGDFEDLKDSKFRRDSIQGAIISLTVIHQIPILRSRDPYETARLIVFTADQIGRLGTCQLRKSGRMPRRMNLKLLRVIQALPGIGPDRATRLLNHFGSIEKVITASLEDLQKVDKIGPGIANQIRSILQESYREQPED